MKNYLFNSKSTALFMFFNQNLFKGMGPDKQLLSIHIINFLAFRESQNNKWNKSTVSTVLAHLEGRVDAKFVRKTLEKLFKLKHITKNELHYIHLSAEIKTFLLELPEITSEEPGKSAIKQSPEESPTLPIEISSLLEKSGMKCKKKRRELGNEKVMETIINHIESNHISLDSFKEYFNSILLILCPKGQNMSPESHENWKSDYRSIATNKIKDIFGEDEARAFIYKPNDENLKFIDSFFTLDTIHDHLLIDKLELSKKEIQDLLYKYRRTLDIRLQDGDEKIAIMTSVSFFYRDEDGEFIKGFNTVAKKRFFKVYDLIQAEDSKSHSQCKKSVYLDDYIETPEEEQIDPSLIVYEDFKPDKEHTDFMNSLKFENYTEEEK